MFVCVFLGIKMIFEDDFDEFGQTHLVWPNDSDKMASRNFAAGVFRTFLPRIQPSCVYASISHAERSAKSGLNSHLENKQTNAWKLKKLFHITTQSINRILNCLDLYCQSINQSIDRSSKLLHTGISNMAINNRTNPAYQCIS